MNYRDDDYVRGREFQNFRDDVMRQFDEVKEMTSEQTREFRKWMEKIQAQLQPLTNDYNMRKEHSNERRKDKQAVRNSIIDWVLKSAAGGALGTIVTLLELKLQS